MWSPELPYGYEARKCRYRVISLCKGKGLDLNAQNEKIVPNAVGICSYHSKGADILLDLSENDALRMFADDSFDYVFDTHQLGNFTSTKEILKEWWRVVKYGGYLILYEQDRDYYPRAGTPGADIKRKKDLVWEEAWKAIKSFGNAKLISASRHNEANEYSWQLVVRKRMSIIKKPFDFLGLSKKDGEVCFPRKKKTNKEALVTRHAAFGDTMWITPVFSELKKQGYYVVVNTNEKGASILRENPNIDEFIIHDIQHIPYHELASYWNYIGRGFEKVINLMQSIEGGLLAVEDSVAFGWSHKKRHEVYNYNFQDRTMEVAGFPECKGKLPELYFSEIEESLAGEFRENRKDKFLIVWALAGSAFHKVYPWAEYVAGELSNNYGDIEIVTIGDESCRILEWQNGATNNKSGLLTPRQSFVLTKYADLVIGPDTGALNAASCFDTPKIVLMSANSVENLTKYWKNCTALWAENCPCYPCHRLIYTESCPKGPLTKRATLCMEGIKPEDVLLAVDKQYRAWKQEKIRRRSQLNFAAMTIADNELTRRLANRARKSFKKFHPDVPFYILDPRDEEQYLGSVRVSTSSNPCFAIRPRFMSHLLKEYDAVIYLDADTVTTDRLTEFLEGDYDIAGSLNIGGDKNGFMNAGVCAATNKTFCDEWTEEIHKPNAGESNQYAFNNLANSKRYRVKVVDTKDVYYNETSREYWNDIEVKSDGLYVNGRKIKVLHWAGGVSRMEEKLSCKDFSKPVRQYLNNITETTDFTDYEGGDVSKW